MTVCGLTFPDLLQRKRVDAPPVKIEGRVTRASVAAAKPPAASTRSAQGRTSTTGKVNTTRPKQSNVNMLKLIPLVVIVTVQRSHC